MLNKDLLLEETFLLEMDGLLDTKFTEAMVMLVIQSLLMEMLILEVEQFILMEAPSLTILLKKTSLLEEFSMDLLT